MAKSLQQKIKDIRNESNDDSDIEPNEYENLILDEINVERLTDEDGKYLATFKNLDILSMNQTHLKSLENFPAELKLHRLELAENQLTGDELKHLKKYGETLSVLKLAGNKINTLADLEHLKDLKCLTTLDMGENDITNCDGYKEKCWKMFEKLEILDNHNKDGASVFSDEDDDDYGSFDSEEGADGKFPGGVDGQFLDDDNYGDEGFEGGEDDMEDFEDEFNEDEGLDEESDQPANKRVK